MFTLRIKKYDESKKLQFIKLIKETLNLGLKESKELIESKEKIILKDATKALIEKTKEKLDSLGAETECF